jgi:pimeloyl-ACP methyl ester carboxylesterase
VATDRQTRIAEAAGIPIGKALYLVGIGSTMSFAAGRMVDPVEGMHRAIARPWLEALGPAGRSVRLAHDSMLRLVYGSIRLGVVTAGIGLDLALAAESATADSVRAFVDGLWARARQEDVAAASMSVRDGSGHEVRMGSALAPVFPTATGHIVVLVHGLTRTERCWHGDIGRPGLMQALEERPELTPVAIRYNTGLDVGTNAELLSSLIDRLRSSWPVPVESIALVGHSMGGLVIHAACAAAGTWIDDVTEVVTIGTPHRGAPLEKLIHAAAAGLDLVSQTRPLAAALDARSLGIKDLRLGSEGLVRDATQQGGARSGGTVRYHVVAGVVTADPAHPMGAILGDLMVRPASATGIPSIDPASVVVVGGVNHFDLLRSPAVIERILGWLARARG